MVTTTKLTAAIVLALFLSVSPTGIYARGGGGGGGGGHSGGSVSVHGYTRSNGTYVAPYTRHAPGEASNVTGSSPSWTNRVSTSSHTPQVDLGPDFWDEPPAGTAKHRATHETPPGIQRDGHGKIKRSVEAKDDFKREHPCPSTGGTSGACPGYVIDHVIPLKRGGRFSGSSERAH